MQPFNQPTIQQSNQPSIQASNQPIIEEFVHSTIQPSSQSIIQPTSSPSFEPTIEALVHPTYQPPNQLENPRPTENAQMQQISPISAAEENRRRLYLNYGRPRPFYRSTSNSSTGPGKALK